MAGADSPALSDAPLPTLQTSRLIRRADRKAGNSVLDLPIGELPEIRIIVADRAEELVILKADHVVGLFPHGDERIGRRDRRGEHQLARLADARGAKRRPGRGAGGDAVVDDDGDTPSHIDGRPIAEIELAAALDFGKFPVANGLEFSI